MSNKKILLQCNQLCKSYQEGGIYTHVLKNVSFSVKYSEMIAIIGCSGSGKSTLMHLLGGLDTATSGTVLFEGQALNAMSTSARAKLRNRELGFIYQFHHLLQDFTALENVAMPLLIGKINRSRAEKKAYFLLKSLGLANRAFHKPCELSGGERQRVAIARAMVNNPRLILADEPTGNLDTDNANTIFDIISELNYVQRTSFLVVTHDMKLANRMQRQMEMCDGQLSEKLNK